MSVAGSYVQRRSMNDLNAYLVVPNQNEPFSFNISEYTASEGIYKNKD